MLRYSARRLSACACAGSWKRMEYGAWSTERSRIPDELWRFATASSSRVRLSCVRLLIRTRGTGLDVPCVRARPVCSSILPLSSILCACGVRRTAVHGRLCVTRGANASGRAPGATPMRRGGGACVVNKNARPPAFSLKHATTSTLRKPQGRSAGRRPEALRRAVRKAKFDGDRDNLTNGRRPAHEPALGV